jgi:hypothetical protein
MAEKACHLIRRVDKYVDTDGREVLEFVPIFGKNKEAPLVKGSVIVHMGMAGPDGKPVPGTGQNVRLEWAFPDDTTVKKAFETFDVEAEAEVKRFTIQQKEKRKANSVIGATKMPTLLGLDGKPLRPGG